MSNYARLAHTVPAISVRFCVGTDGDVFIYECGGMKRLVASIVRVKLPGGRDGWQTKVGEQYGEPFLKPSGALGEAMWRIFQNAQSVWPVLPDVLRNAEGAA